MVVNNVVSDNNVVSNNNVVSDEKYTYSQLVDRFVNFKDSYVGKQSSVCKKLQRACFVEYDSFGVEKYKPIKHLTKSQYYSSIKQNCEQAKTNVINNKTTLFTKLANYLYFAYKSVKSIFLKNNTHKNLHKQQQ